MSIDRSTTLGHYATRRYMKTIRIYNNYLSGSSRARLLLTPGNDSIVFDAMARSPFRYGLRGIY